MILKAVDSMVPLRSTKDETANIFLFYRFMLVEYPQQLYHTLPPEGCDRSKQMPARLGSSPYS